jgi:hypothetical protein
MLKIVFALIVLLFISIIADLYSPIKGEGFLLLLVISSLVIFNNDIKNMYKTGSRLDKALILLSIFWFVLSSSYLMVFLEYELEDFFGRYGLYGTSILLYPIVFLIIGRWFYKIYKDSL